MTQRPGSDTRDSRIGVTFNTIVGCFGILGGLFAVIAVVVALAAPERVIYVLRELGDIPEPTAVVIYAPTYTPYPTPVLPSPTPGPTDTPQPTAIPTPDRRLFWDDFDQGMKSDWQSEYGKWQMVNGTLKITESTSNGALVVVGDPGWQDYAVDLDTGSYLPDWGFSEGNSITIHTRIKGKGNSVWFHMFFFGASCGIDRNGESRLVEEIAEEGIGGGDHHLSVEARGNQFKFWIDNRLICHFEDEDYATGRVGIWGRAEEEPPPWIDNFQVMTLP